MRRIIFVAVVAAVTALVFGVLGEEGGKVQATHTVTITAEASGLVNPSITSASSLPNEDFTITCNPAPGPCSLGDGVDEFTAWTLDFTNEDNFQECFGGVLTSALLTLTLTPFSLFATDSVGITGAGGIPAPGVKTLYDLSPPDLFPALPGDTRTITVDFLTSALSALNNPAGAVAIRAVYNANDGKIPMAYQDDAIISFARLELTCEVAHVFGDKMYWTDAGTNKIQRANLDGTGVVDTNVVDLVTTGLVTPLGIALDRAERKMYWVDGNSADPLQTIELADMIVNPVVGPPAVTGPPPATGYTSRWIWSATLKRYTGRTS